MNDLWIFLFHDRAQFTFPVGIILAAFVTVHVLLHKREVASAVGWIGFAWFAPITGSVTYAVLGVNRVRRRAQLLRPEGRRRPGTGDWPSPWGEHHLEPLRHGIGRLTGRDLLAGNAVQIYQNGDAAYPPMLAAIDAARHSIGLSSYIFRNDRWGGQFIEKLIAAQQRGVQVRVLIDGIGGGWLLSRAYRRLRRHNVPAARFLHSLLPWRMPFLNLRSHRKILVVDGAIGFTGGMNIGDENVLATNPKEPVQDTHFCVEGPVVCQLTEAFAQDWAFATRETLNGGIWFPDLSEAGKAPARIVDSGPDESIEKVEFSIMQAIACARTCIEIMTPYFLPDERMITALALAAMRGVAVGVVIPGTSNKTSVDHATRANISPLLTAGVNIWRSPPPFHHTKLMVVDNEWCLIGSTNWDIRSFRLNFELCVEAYDRDLATALSTLMQSNRGPALTEDDIKQRSLTVRLRDSAWRLLMPYL